MTGGQVPGSVLRRCRRTIVMRAPRVHCPGMSLGLSMHHSRRPYLKQGANGWRLTLIPFNKTLRPEWHSDFEDRRMITLVYSYYSDKARITVDMHVRIEHIPCYLILHLSLTTSLQSAAASSGWDVWRSIMRSRNPTHAMQYHHQGRAMSYLTSCPTPPSQE